VTATTLAMPKQSILRRHRDRLLGVLAVLAFLALWEAVTRAGWVDPRFSSSPTRIIAAYRDVIEAGFFFSDLALTGQVFLTGFALAVGTGVPIGFLMGWYRPVQSLLNPFVSFFNATPRIALLPLFVIWFGIGMGSKVAVVYMAALFPIVINSSAAIKSLDASVLRAARSFGASDLQLFRTVALPGSVPFVLTGLRLGLAQALTATVVAEFFAATAGIGYLIAVSGNTFRTDKVFVGVTVVAITGVLLSVLLLRIERHFQSWRPSAN
jgi:ABC-type nitrate/sulfonate/bicarbonate transport system permease component